MSRVVVTLVLLCGPSVFMWVQFAGILPAYPMLTVELMLPVLLARFAPGLAAASYLCLSLLDLLVSIAAVFHFPSPLGLFVLHSGGAGFPVLESLKDNSRFLLVSFVLLASGLVFVKLGRFVYWRSSALIIGGVIALEAIGLTRVLPPTGFGEINLIGSTVAGNLARMTGFKTNSSRTYSDPMPLSSAVLTWAEENPGRSILFVVSESLGLQVPTPNNDQFPPRIAPPAHHSFSMSAGVVPYSGATTAGELRQMCQLRVPYYDLSALDVHQCLPRKMRDLGLHTVGLHGYSSRVFSRQSWWEDIGLSERIFLEDMVTEGPHRCGKTLSGVCDEAVLTRAIEKVRVPGSFVYFLTLTTHLPVDASVVSPSIKAECASSTGPVRPCWLVGMHSKLLEDIVVKTASINPPPLVVIVGDHSPPFIDKDERRVFSQKLVPYWILRPTR